MAATPRCEPGALSRRPLLAGVLAAAFGASARAEDDPLRLLRQPGAVGLMRHARAPGTGDPPGFRVDDCTTQRNLSDEGRDQARALGRRMRAAGLETAQVHSSAWCRARETAELLGFGPVNHLQPLDSLFEDRRASPDHIAGLRAFMDTGREGPPRLLVSHQVNITALTGLFPADAELLVLLPGPDGYQVAGRVRPDQAAATGTR